MRPVRRNLLLLAILAAEIALILALAPDYGRPNLEFLPDMAHQPRANAFAASRYFPDGKTLREPPAGTIPRGLPPLPYTASKADAGRAGRELDNPISTSQRKGALRRGKRLFSRFCAPCHGAEGAGDGTVALRGYPPPPRFDAPHAVGLADGQLFHILTFGQGNMPSYATQIDREDRWRLVLFVRTLQHAARKKQQTLVPKKEAER